MTNLTSKPVYTPQDIYKIWRYDGGRSAIQRLGRSITVSTPRIEAQAFADIANGILSLHARGAHTWQDYRGNVRPGRSFIYSVFRFALDILSSHFVARYHASKARKYAAREKISFALNFGRAPLYLRTDHLFDLRAGGSVAHTAGVLNALREKYGIVNVVSTDHLTSVVPDSHFFELIPHYSIGRNLPNIPLLTYNSRVISFVRKTTKRPSFIYSRYSLGNYSALALARIFGVPYVCEYNGSNIWISRNWDTQKMKYEEVMLQIEDANLSGADVIVAVSQPSKDELVERGFDTKKILVNPNGVDPMKYGDDSRRVETRSQLGFTEQDIVIGFVGTFGHWHGTTVLAEAFHKLKSSYPAEGKVAKLLLVGDGNFRAECEDMIARCGLSDNVVFTGTVSQDDAPAMLSASDILASPHVPNPDGSRFFGSPTKLFEYMAANRAIIASDLDQIGEVLKDRENALLVKPGDASSLAEGLAILVRDRDLRLSLGRNARQRCLSEHTWQKHTNNILEALQRLA